MIKSTVVMQIITAIEDLVRVQIRHVAGWLDRLSRGRLTPSMVTTVGVAMHLPIALLIGRGELVWAAILLIIFGLFDVLDGELARLQKTASLQGMIYDATTDRIKEVVLFSGIAYWLNGTSSAGWAWLAVYAAGIALTIPYAKAKAEVVIALKGKITDHHIINRHYSEGIASFDILMTIIVLGLVFNSLLIATAMVAILSSIALIKLGITIRKEVGTAR